MLGQETLDEYRRMLPSERLSLASARHGKRSAIYCTVRRRPSIFPDSVKT